MANVLVVDDSSTVRNELGNFLTQNGFKVAYHGPLDERFNSAKPNLAAKAKSPYTAHAIDALLAGQPVAPARVAFAEAGRRATRVQVDLPIRPDLTTHRLAYRWRWTA